MKQICFFILFILALASKAGACIPEGDSLLPVLNRPAPEFKLKDLNGKTVTLASLKGKIVILDFWATWCAPCAKSFPAMQKAMEHYAKDKDVVFLFIDTREKSANAKQLAGDYIKKNNYNFHVLLDENDAKGAKNKCYTSYNMAGIPTKFIIDAKGVIRFKLEGYHPELSDEEAANGLIYLIEQVRELGELGR